jgi:hypothetical protein
VVEGDRASTEEDEAKGKGGQSQRELVSVVAHQSIVEVYFGDGDRHVDADGKSRGTGKQADNHKHAAKELGEGGEICGPARKSKAGDELNVMVKSAENLVISVANHDGAQSETHDEQSERLQAIKVAQVSSGGKRNIDYSSEVTEGSGFGMRLTSGTRGGNNELQAPAVHPAPVQGDRGRVQGETAGVRKSSRAERRKEVSNYSICSST